VLEVITPGFHGSTFGGNPLAAAIGREVIAMLHTGELQKRAETLGDRLAAGRRELVSQGVDEVRARGRWAGVDISPELSTGRHACKQLLDHGILAKEEHGQTVRLARPWSPPRRTSTSWSRPSTPSALVELARRATRTGARTRRMTSLVEPRHLKETHHGPATFAAGELSNGVWWSYTPDSTVEPDVLLSAAMHDGRHSVRPRERVIAAKSRSAPEHEIGSRSLVQNVDA
jgi:hypothetical protein